MSSLNQATKPFSFLFTQLKGPSKYDTACRIVFAILVLRSIHGVYDNITYYGVLGGIRKALERCWRCISPTAQKPAARRIFKRVDADLEAITNMIAQKFDRQGDASTRNLSLPAAGWSYQEVEEELEQLRNLDHTRWEDGRVSGTVYHGGSELLDMQTQAIGKFSVSNPIHPDCFPGVRKMEAEIVAMVCLFVCFSCTLIDWETDLERLQCPRGWRRRHHKWWYGVDSHGLSGCSRESRSRARRHRSRDVRPFLSSSAFVSMYLTPSRIIPCTAHAAFYKAAQYFRIKLHVISCPAPSYKASIPEMRQLINQNTVLLVASAPNFPHGIVDNIPLISQLATAHQIPLHVDCCLGSLVIALLGQSGFPSPYEDQGGFDFRQPGVTSISVDTHKYGFAPKGSSVLLYRNRSYRNYQYFLLPDWSGGVYASPSMAGSRPGSLIASTWATLVKTGVEGYIASCKQIVGAAKRLESAIREHPLLSDHLSIVGEPMASVVAFRSSTEEIDTYDIADAMDARGWHLNSLQAPAAIHCAFTIPTAEAVESLVEDLVEVTREMLVRAEERKNDKGEKTVQARGKSAALYGVGGSIDHSVAGRFAEGFLDTLYKA